MRLCPCVLGFAALFLIGACAQQQAVEPATGAWVGTITTEGNVTTVVNESGSVWGGRASLVEELSIGVESGPDEYMFGEIAGIYATDDEIYVIDGQKPAVRVYDFEGRHLRDLGGAGEGPGEYRRPTYVTGTEDGTIHVMSRRNQRLNLYGPEPGAVDSWPLSRWIQCCIRPFVVAPGGAVWVEIGVLNEERLDFDPGMQMHGPDGPIGDPLMVPEFEYERWTYRRNGREIEAVQYAPGIVWAIAPPGLLVAGASDRYRFEIHSPEGTVTVVEKQADPVELIDPELEYARLSMERHQEVDFVWNGRIPSHKPVYWFFLPTHSGEIWVFREGKAEPIPDCDPTEPGASPAGGMAPRPKRCFTAPQRVDVFEIEGRYLGEIDLSGLPTHIVHSYIRGDTVVTTSQDDMGTIMVKRYRLVLPGEQEQ